MTKEEQLYQQFRDMGYDHIQARELAQHASRFN